LQIHWRNCDELSEEQRRNAEQRLQKLAADHTDLIDVRISGKTTGHHRRGGQEIRIVCMARGKELVAARTREDMGKAFNEALDAFEREVWRMREKRQDKRVERPALPPVLGVIDRVFVDDGYGFILTDDGEQVYFHRNAVGGGLSFESLEEGQRVGLNVESGAEGPQANVVLAPPPDVASP